MGGLGGHVACCVSPTVHSAKPRPLITCYSNTNTQALTTLHTFVHSDLCFCICTQLLYKIRLCLLTHIEMFVLYILEQIARLCTNMILGEHVETTRSQFQINQQVYNSVNTKHVS